MYALISAAWRDSRLLSTVIAIALFALGLPALAGSDAAQATITIDNFTFKPASLTIKPGTKVTFVNRDDIPHSIAGVGNTFRSKVLDTDQTFEYTFATAGDYDYFCALHPHMKGRIIVMP